MAHLKAFFGQSSTLRSPKFMAAAAAACVLLVSGCTNSVDAPTADTAPTSVNPEAAVLETIATANAAYAALDHDTYYSTFCAALRGSLPISFPPDELRAQVEEEQLGRNGIDVAKLTLDSVAFVSESKAEGVMVRTQGTVVDEPSAVEFVLEEGSWKMCPPM